MSKEDIERLNTAIISSHVLKDEIKTAAVAGTNVSRISGNAPNSTACVLFHTPKAGFTYAVAEVKEKTRLEGKKYMPSTFLPESSQNNARHNACAGRQRIAMIMQNGQSEPSFRKAKKPPAVYMLIPQYSRFQKEVQANTLFQSIPFVLFPILR